MEIIKNINPNIFRAYDIRGEYPTFIDEDVAYTIGLGYGSYIKGLGDKECVIGFDNRLSSESLFNALVAGILETGINIINIGLVTTPMLYFSRTYLNVPATIMITASHNPGNENGFKFSFDKSGNVKGNKMTEFANYVNEANFKTGNGIMTNKDIKGAYVEALTKDASFPKRLKVVLDLGNGTTNVVAKDVFSKLNIEVSYLFDISDGTFPNHHPDPSVRENMVSLGNKVKELKADIGISFDGDGDRLGIVDNLGDFIPSDLFSPLFIKDILSTNSNKKVLGDVKCTKALKDTVISMGGEYIECRSGASFMMSYVPEENAIFGAEYSGHIYFNDRFLPISSALYAAIRLLEILSKETKSINDLLKEAPTYYKSDEIRIPTTDDLKFKIVHQIEEYINTNNLTISKIDGIKVIYPDGWALIRASNTGANLTVIFEFNSEKRLIDVENEYLNLINLYNK